MGNIFNRILSLARCLKLALLVVLLFSSSSHAETQPRFYFGQTTNLRLAEKSPSQSNQMSCAARIQEFVSELDILLDTKPNALEPFLSLLKKYFPLTGCDIQEVKSIARKSKYFDSIYEQGSLVVFSFSNAGPYSVAFTGFDIIFAISRLTGATELPFAKIHKGG